MMGNVTGIRISYHDNEQSLEGYLAAPPSARNLAGVLILPSWLNVVESMCRKADLLAELGYTVFVADLVGAGVLPRPPQQPMAVVAPFLENRLFFRQRLSAGLKTLQSRPECNSDCIAAIGYCLGGCGALELARASAPLRGVVSLHGLLTTTLPAQRNSIQAKVLVLHGDADPLTTFDQLAAFRNEMSKAEANWEIDIYGGARHSFTGEGVLDQSSPEAGLHPQSEARSWQRTVEFLAEVLK